MSYTEARGKFLTAAQGAGADIHSIPHPNKGPNNEALFMDFAVIGPADAANALVIVSGTHGTEGYCGSGCQVKLLSNVAELAKFSDFRLVCIHAHNPYGFAWARRVNEDNVDINRNYVDFSQKPDTNEGYRAIQDLILPDVFDDSSEATLNAWIDEQGKDIFLQTALSGQRVDPKGIFFGGLQPVWSNKVMRECLPNLVQNQKCVLVIDFHTGLGPFGHGDIFHTYPKSSRENKVFNDWFEGQAVATIEEQYEGDASYQATGAFVSALDSILPGQKTLGLVIEYGTVEIERVVRALRADNWLHMQGVIDSDQGQKIKQEMFDCFYSPTEKWQQMIWDRAVWLFERSARGLKALPTDE